MHMLFILRQWFYLEMIQVVYFCHKNFEFDSFIEFHGRINDKKMCLLQCERCIFATGNKNIVNCKTNIVMTKVHKNFVKNTAIVLQLVARMAAPCLNC